MTYKVKVDREGRLERKLEVRMTLADTLDRMVTQAAENGNLAKGDWEWACKVWAELKGAGK